MNEEVHQKLLMGKRELCRSFQFDNYSLYDPALIFHKVSLSSFRSLYYCYMTAPQFQVANSVLLWGRRGAMVEHNIRSGTAGAILTVLPQGVDIPIPWLCIHLRDLYASTFHERLKHFLRILKRQDI